MKRLGLTSDNKVNGNLYNELKKEFTDNKILGNIIKFAKYYESNEINVRGVEALETKMS